MFADRRRAREVVALDHRLKRRPPSLGCAAASRPFQCQQEEALALPHVRRRPASIASRATKARLLPFPELSTRLPAPRLREHQDARSAQSRALRLTLRPGHLATPLRSHRSVSRVKALAIWLSRERPRRGELRLEAQPQPDLFCRYQKVRDRLRETAPNPPARPQGRQALPGSCRGWNSPLWVPGRPCRQPAQTPLVPVRARARSAGEPPFVAISAMISAVEDEPGVQSSHRQCCVQAAPARDFERSLDWRQPILRCLGSR